MVEPKVHYIECVSLNRWAVKHGATHLFRHGQRTLCGDIVLTAKERVDQLPGLEVRDTPTCIRCLALATAGDFILKERIDQKPYRRFRFPEMILHGLGCGGYCGIRWRGEDLKNPQLALQVSLIRFGTTMQDWDNPPPTGVCGCDQRLMELEPEVAKMFARCMVSDTGWRCVGGLASRGIHDYERSITFSKPLDDDQLALLKQWVELKDNPGWANKGCRQGSSRGTYVFYSTMDSSD